MSTHDKNEVLDKTRSNSVELIEAVIKAMKEAGMTVQAVKEPDINTDSAVEHTADFDVVFKQVLFNVRIESILFAGWVKPTGE